ncbi:hypothetical protein DNU06_07895 [Putridiphycobacter roseus]|uniref:Beta-lactamase-related domain-containing protein n=1 Tax=Putridiphycobacter roseus TaxID=2219161 RepID=A0A2W1NGS2_9FLAO|nr:serine hydrolase [Putridiphycobacter roseus]PZE17186.1 hypothetical protein DNU06_07895 [Putridiphycobacter roseus]
MKANKQITLILFSILSLLACQKNKVLPIDNYACNFIFNDSSAVHPKASIYQQILDDNIREGLVGAVLLVKDKNGMWIGSGGKADIASNVDMKPCNTFLIASISKVFTAAAIFRYVDKGVLSLDDPISKWLPSEIVERVDNAAEAKIGHLLSHRSGIVDYYTDRFELDRVNKVNNHFTKEQAVTYIYDKKAHFPVGETYRYCNSNFVLLSIILEKASGQPFESVYTNEVFSPLGLYSAYYSESKPIPDGCVKGYYDLYNSGELTESQNLYQDELGIGGDGCIAINAYDLALFFEQLMKGALISPASLNEMTDWFDLPEDWHWETYGQTENGYGIEKFNTQNGVAVGHTGGIDGFNSYAFYYPETDMSYVLLVNNTRAFNTSKDQIFKSVSAVMFE